MRILFAAICLIILSSPLFADDTKMEATKHCKLKAETVQNHSACCCLLN